MSDSGHRKAALLVSGCFFMQMLDGTIVTTSAPKIARALSVTTGTLSVIITAYAVTTAALIPLSGWLCSRFGARRIFLVAIACFTLASLGCALSSNLGQLVAMRVLQGLGGALMVPVGRLVVLSASARSDLLRTTAYLVWPALIAPVVAPLAGGLITTYASWHWLFLINVPLGALALVLALRLIVSPAQPRAPRLDVLGVVLTAAGLGGLTVTATLLAGSSPRAALVLGVGLASAALLVVAVRHLLSTDAPLVNLRTLHNHTLRSSLSGGSVYFSVIGSAPFLVPLLFQQVFGWSAVKSGALVLWIFVGNIGIKPATTFLYRRFGFRAVLVASTALQALTMIVIAFTTAAVPATLIAIVLVLSGIARSVGATGYSTLPFSETTASELPDANTLQAIVQQLAGGFGVAIGAIALRVGHPVGNLFSSHPAATMPYTVAFLIMAALSLVACAGAAGLHPSAGDVMRPATQRL